MLDRLPIRAKLYAGFGAILVLLVGVAATAFCGTSNITSAADNIDTVVSHKLVVAQEMSAAAGDFHYSQTKYVLVGPSARQDFLADVGAFRDVLAQADRNTTDPKGRATLAGVKASFADFMGVDAQMWAAVQAGHHRKALELVGASDESVDTLTAKLDAFLSEARPPGGRDPAPFGRFDDPHRVDRPRGRRGARRLGDRLPPHPADLGRARSAQGSPSKPP